MYEHYKGSTGKRHRVIDASLESKVDLCVGDTVASPQALRARG